jgi:hypothetical protein
MSIRKNASTVTKNLEIPLSKLDLIVIQEDNSRLKEMKSKLSMYKLEVQESIKCANPIENDFFKKPFYESLETLLKEMSYITEKSLRNEKIETIYKWYYLKVSSFKKLNKIDSRSKSYTYEILPNTSDYLKSSYYEAINYPEHFEKEHRTEEGGLLPPKDRLKEFKTKKIGVGNKDSQTKQINNFNKSKEDLNNINEDKQRLYSAESSIAMRATNYTASQTSGKFFQSSSSHRNLEVGLDPVREIKSSYSYYRPKYDLTNLNIEKNSVQAKHREVAEKRNQEEMKEFMNEYSINKAFYKEEVEKKFATRSLMNFYKAELKEDGQDLDYETNMNNTYDVACELKFKTNDELEYEDDIKKEQTVQGIEGTLGIIKVDMNNIKNIGENNKLILNRDEVCVNIRLKDDISLKQETLLNTKNKNEKIPTDSIAILKVIDPLYNTRYNYSKIIDVKEIDNPKTEYKTMYNPLSAYDSMNLNLISSSSSPVKIYKNRPSTGYEFVRDNFQKNDLLGQKNILNNHKLNEYYRLKDNLIKLNNKTVSFPILKNCFLPPSEDVKYPKFYLPMAGAGMLSRPLEVTTKKKRGKK